MSSLEISKHQIYFKQTVISVPRPIMRKNFRNSFIPVTFNNVNLPMNYRYPNTQIKYPTRFLTVLQNLHEEYINFLRKTLQEGNVQSL